MAITFDGPNLRIILDSGDTEVNVQTDLYSAWKNWAKTPGNEVHEFAFSTTGGDPVTATGNVAPYYFLNNTGGWRIRPAEEDINVILVGNLYGLDPALPIFEATTGAYTVLVAVERDASSVVEEVPTITGALTLPQFLALK